MCLTSSRQDMALRFSNFEGARLQRGRGIGGLLRAAASVFKPFINTITKAAGSRTGQKLIKTVKKQALESGTNILSDVISGANVGDSINSEYDTAKKNIGKKVGRVLKESIGIKKEKRKRPATENKSNIKRRRNKNTRQRIF